jgi:hypothetical protein
MDVQSSFVYSGIPCYYRIPYSWTDEVCVSEMFLTKSMLYNRFKYISLITQILLNIMTLLKFLVILYAVNGFLLFLKLFRLTV